MAYALIVRSASGFLLLTALALACSTADGLDTGTGAGGTGDQDPGKPDKEDPDPYGEACGPEVVLSPGDHRIVLLSIDRRGAHDVTSLAFTRRCT